MISDEEISDEIFFEFTTGPCDVRWFASVFFTQRWTETFLANELEDIDISVGHWEAHWQSVLSSNQMTTPSQQSLSIPREKPTSMRRIVRSFHPSAVSFPGLSTHAENIKEQRLRLHSNGRRLTMRESTTLNGIPMSDYFVINMVWIVEEIPLEDSSNSFTNENRLGKTACRVRIYIEIDFKKSTWFQRTIISNTKAELRTVCEKWQSCVLRDVAERPVDVPEEISPLYRAKPGASSNGIAQDPIGMMWDETGHYMTSDIISTINSANISRGRIASSGSISPAEGSVGTGAIIDSEDEDAVFYDCQSDFPDIENSVFDREKDMLLPTRITSSSAANTSYRNLVISFVDIFFILFEFLYWQLYYFYQHDMKYFFDVPNTYEIAKRAFGSVVPRVQDDILAKPDLFGPSICVFILPQIFLAAIDTSRHGCTRSSLLGNGVVVSVCMWAGISVLLRLLSFVIAPKLKLSQFVCSIGYSFFAWALSLGLSIAFDQLSGSPFGLPPALPLVLIGLPAAAKQGLVFWEFTAPSPLKLDPNFFPISMRGFVDRHHTMLQYLLWAVPKALALVVVAGTHYQCLWYLARVFLPGKQQQCRLSRLIQPSAYADILAQKELIRYAGELIKTGHVPPA